jgi:hypothetical protein
METKQLKAVKTIIENGGECRFNNPSCGECPFTMLRGCCHIGKEGSGSLQLSEAWNWFKAYLAEHDSKKCSTCKHDELIDEDDEPCSTCDPIGCNYVPKQLEPKEHDKPVYPLAPFTLGSYTEDGARIVGRLVALTEKMNEIVELVNKRVGGE